MQFLFFSIVIKKEHLVNKIIINNLKPYKHDII